MDRLHRLPLRAAVVAAVCALVAAPLTAEPASAAAAGAGDPEVVAGELLVQWRPGSTASDRAAARRAHGLERAEQLTPGGLELVRLSDGDTPRGRAAALARHPHVAYAEPNHILRPAAEPNEHRLWGLHNDGKTVDGIVKVADVDMDVPESTGTGVGSPSTIVAVVDTGVQIEHPDLAANVWVNTAERDGEPGIDDDGNGYVDDLHGWDWHHDDATVYDAGDGDSHGTHVAGTIAAPRNGVGVVGVAPEVRILPLKFLGPNGGTTSDAIRAIRYATAQGARVINASWGGGGYSQGLHDAIRDSGAVFVAAAGNGGSDKVGDDNDTSPMYPASYDLPNVLAVAAVTPTGGLAGFSNYGATSVDVGAPGEKIYSTVPGGYTYMSGTSMAAPNAAGVAALLADRLPEATAGALVTTLRDTVSPLASLATTTASGGMVNAEAALGTTWTATVPGAPSDVSATAGVQSAEVRWTAPADGGSVITGYTVTAAPDGATASVDGATTTATVAGLTAGTAYTFTVTATNAVGTGDPSEPSGPVTPTAPTTSGGTSGGGTSGGGGGGGDTGGTDDTGGDPVQDDPTEETEVTEACPEGSTSSAGFEDVGAGNVHLEAIDCVTAWQVASGTTATTYAPEATVTRAQMARFIAQVVAAAGVPLDTSRDHFDDDDGSFHEDAINALATAGIVDGTDARTYSPSQRVSRAQMAAYLVRTYEYVSAVTVVATRDHFTDDDGTFHEGAIDAAAELGLATGRTATSYEPAGSVRRDQMASFLRRLLDVLAAEARLGSSALR